MTEKLSPPRLSLLRALANLPENTCRYGCNIRVAEQLCRDGLADCVGDLGSKGFGYIATPAGRAALEGGL